MENVRFRYGVVGVGGGTGQETTLRGAMEYFPPEQIGSVITVFDDGGCWGVMSKAYGCTLGGDWRRSHYALADPQINPEFRRISQHRFHSSTGSLSEYTVGQLLSEALIEQFGQNADVASKRAFKFAQLYPQFEKLLEFRFQEKSVHGDAITLKGRNMGNLILGGLSLIAEEEGIDGSKLCKDMFGVKGNIEYIANQTSKLEIIDSNGKKISGESAIGERHLATDFDPSSKIVQLKLENDDISINKKAAGMLKNTGVIVIGPGSAVTSLGANLVTPGMSDTLSEARENGTDIVYEPPLFSDSETNGQRCVSENLEFMSQFMDLRLITRMAVNSLKIPKRTRERYEEYGQFYMVPDTKKCQKLWPWIRIDEQPLSVLDDDDRARHNLHVVGKYLYKVSQSTPPQFSTSRSFVVAKIA
jgi:uncharacterized cofD-like protein